LHRQVLLSAPDITSEERRLVDEVLRSSHLSCGPVLATFEREFAARFDARHAVAMSSGTAALHVALIAAGVGEGDVVVTTPFSFVASANAILFERGTPHFVDIDPETLSIDPAATVDAIERLAPRGNLRAVLPVHIFGRPAEMSDIVRAARNHGIAVIEDACEAIGASADGVLAGRWGDASAFGFYPNKQMTTGEGGILLTDRDDWARLARSLRNQGRSDDGSWLQHDRLGFNYRLTDLACALGLAQLGHLDEMLAARRSVSERYREALSEIEELELPCADGADGEQRGWFVFVVQLPRGCDRDGVVRELAARGIQSKPYLPAIHLMSFYRERFGHREGEFPVCEDVAARSLALPFFPEMSEGQVARVAQQLRAALQLSSAGSA
jgi:dTDP-4-amino-4,6-dideoxygalactose transaminase